jgi:hypothetical protein
MKARLKKKTDKKKTDNKRNKLCEWEKKMYNLLDADSNSTLNKISGLKLKKLKAKSAKKIETEESATLEFSFN